MERYNDNVCACCPRYVNITYFSAQGQKCIVHWAGFIRPEALLTTHSVSWLVAQSRLKQVKGLAYIDDTAAFVLFRDTIQHYQHTIPTEMVTAFVQKV